jgi:predicted Zn-dependent protease
MRPGLTFPVLAVTLAAALALPSCASLKGIPGASAAGDYLQQKTVESATKVGENAVTAAVTGELDRTASFTMEQEFYLGKTIAATVVSRVSSTALPPDHAAARYLRDVGTVVALAAAEQREATDRPYPLRGYRFILVVSPQVNAVGMPGGFVLVTTGALRAVQSEDELAAILAHEVAHVQRGHVLWPVERAREQEHMTSTLLAGTDPVVHAFFGKVVTLGADFVLDRGYGKSNELAADAFAARILAGAGYDPSALARVLGRLQGPAAQGGFFSRHPPAADRVAALARETRAGAAPPPARVARFQARSRTLD